MKSPNPDIGDVLNQLNYAVAAAIWMLHSLGDEVYKRDLAIPESGSLHSSAVLSQLEDARKAVNELLESIPVEPGRADR